MISEAWIIKLFWRFGEIYGARASEMEKDIKKWQDALEGVTGEQIRLALICYKNNVFSGHLPTPEAFATFAKLCKESIADNENAVSCDNKATGSIENLPLGNPSAQDFYDKTRAEIAEEGRAIVERNIEVAMMDKDNERIQAERRRYKGK